MLKKFILSTSFLLLSSFSVGSWSEIDKPFLAKQCDELAQKIEQLIDAEQRKHCASVIKESAMLVENSGQFILKEYWFSARTDLHRSYRLLRSAYEMKCKTAKELPSLQKGIDSILNQIYGLE